MKYFVSVKQEGVHPTMGSKHFDSRVELTAQDWIDKFSYYIHNNFFDKKFVENGVMFTFNNYPATDSYIYKGEIYLTAEAE